MDAGVGARPHSLSAGDTSAQQVAFPSRPGRLLPRTRSDRVDLHSPAAGWVGKLASVSHHRLSFSFFTDNFYCSSIPNGKINPRIRPPDS